MIPGCLDGMTRSEMSRNADAIRRLDAEASPEGTRSLSDGEREAVRILDFIGGYLQGSTGHPETPYLRRFISEARDAIFAGKRNILGNLLAKYPPLGEGS